MKKFLYTLVLVASFILYGVFQTKFSNPSALFSDDDDKPVTAPASLQINSNTSTSYNSNTNTTTVSNTPTTKNPPTNTTNVNTTPVATKGKYKDGTYIGSVADAYYGNLQVKAVISGGKITDVVFLQYPNDRGNSIRINTQAIPYLKAEAIQIQDSNVDTVSGASYSSKAFRQSLASALSQAI